MIPSAVFQAAAGWKQWPTASGKDRTIPKSERRIGNGLKCLENLSQSYILKLTVAVKPKQSKTEEEISDQLKTENSNIIRENYHRYFQHIDYSKFKENADPEHIFHMLIWMMDGYLHAQKMTQKPLNLYEIDKEFAQWVELFKRNSYREEFQ